MNSRPITIEVELTEGCARALALYLKRLMLSDFEAKCAKHDDPELRYHMQLAAMAVAKALAGSGVNPR